MKGRERETSWDGGDDNTLELEFISYLIIEPKAISEAYSKVTPDALKAAQSQELYRVISTLYEKGKTWNKTILRSLVDKRIDCSEYLNFTPTTTSVEQFKQIVAAVKRENLKEVLSEFFVKSNIKLQDRPPEDVATETLEYMTKLDASVLGTSDWNVETIIKEHDLLMKDRYEGKLIGVSSGFKDLDVMLGQGMGRKKLIVVGARPSVGKTSFSLSVAFNAAKKGHRVLFVSCEMDGVELYDRLLSFQTGLPLTAIIRGKVPKEKIKAANDAIKKLPLSIMHLPKMTSSEVYTVAMKHKYIHGLDLLVVDYLGFLADEGDNEVQRIGRISRTLKMTANLLDCAVLTPHQLNRAIEKRTGEKGQPMLSDLRESGHVEADADVIIFLNRETVGAKNDKTVLRIGKNRQGECGILDIRFNSLTTKFE